MGTPVLWAPPCPTSDCICLSSSQQNLGFSRESEPALRRKVCGEGCRHKGVSWNVLEVQGWGGHPPVLEGINYFSLVLRRNQDVPGPLSTSLCGEMA